MVYLCATMWHENYSEMMKIIISMFRYKINSCICVDVNTRQLHKQTSLILDHHSNSALIRFRCGSKIMTVDTTTKNTLNDIFIFTRLDKYRPKGNLSNDVGFEFHIFFDDAFKDVKDSSGRHVNEYGETLVEVLKEVYM